MDERRLFPNLAPPAIILKSLDCFELVRKIVRSMVHFVVGVAGSNVLPRRSPNKSIMIETFIAK
jgi:hypothetical protein